MPSRRHFLAGLAAATGLPRMGWAAAGSPAYLAAARGPSGDYALFGLDGTGHDIFRIPLPDRGHAAAAHPTAPEAVAFARRPGRFALVIDCVEGRVAHRLDTPEGRHFYGHGAFLQGGAILATSENEIDTGEGRIGLWSRARGYARIGEIASGGIGPHEILRFSDDVLVVANGGIRTHPDSGREKLNIDDMRANLSYISVMGEMLDQVELPDDLHLNSIRHLALAPDGQVAFAMQWQGDPGDGVPLLGLHRRGQAAILAEADLAEQIAMQGYAGSVAFAADGKSVGITSPRGGRLHVFDDQGDFVASHRRADICGLASGRGGFVATDGLGGILALQDKRLSGLTAATRAWDNHLVAIDG
ncbi:hypothetical protein DSM110093_00399 [Sulfitobacter sp. DSM 110093]|uniref:DUF1513 domain-containing protein n=1 Tax=Sulfitobacter sp. DSM 110093 TaxID=2883127 RepID=UPI001FAB3742|nr:DUF1513 domain-containing protein [Sulfitobacter sp. DSM 110093]UOA30646.1 hypothetical protein DSM110093_00399 [Sulfitobacter sp. DSM 110093]